MMLSPAASASLTALALTAAPAAIVSSRVYQHPIIHRLFHTNPWCGIVLIVFAGIAFLILVVV
jgi:hypothetical protein